MPGGERQDCGLEGIHRNRKQIYKNVTLIPQVFLLSTYDVPGVDEVVRQVVQELRGKRGGFMEEEARGLGPED